MKPFLLFALMVACATATQAADSAASNRFDALSLEQAVKLAERQHPDLAEANALIEAAEGRVRQAGAFPNPEAIARIEQAPFKGRTLDEAEYLAGVAQPVPLGSRLSKAKQAEQLERDRRAKELEVRRRELRKRVHSAFATALYQEKALLTQEEIAASANKVVATTKARLDAGDALREDLARAEMEAARAKVELRRADALREQAMAALTAAIGDPALSVKSLDGTLDTTFEIPTMESLAASLASNPNAALADADIRASEARVDLAKAQRIPDVKVELLYRRLQAEKENAFDVGLSIPLPLFDRNQGRIREARAEAAAAEARSRSTLNDLTFRMRDAHSQLTAALANSRTLKDEILPRADTVLKSAEARYTAGDSSLSEVLPVRRDWAAVQLTYLESLRDVMQAWAALTPFVKGN
jgi:cobalt-zinc-cadmium efflux system outer membrane protein